MLRTTRSITTIGALVLALAAPAGAAAQPTQDLRSPDARDAAGASQIRQDLRSPDARDAAAVTVQPSAPVERSVPSNGFEWGHAGIGGAAMLALVLGLGGLTLLVTRRRVGTPFMH